MHTISLFGGSAKSPKGGTGDFLGTIPFVSPQVILNSILEIEALKGPLLSGDYWADILVTSEGHVSDSKSWLIRVGESLEGESPNLTEVCRTKENAICFAVMYSKSTPGYLQKAE